MTQLLLLVLAMTAFSFLAGTIGSLLGLGGGIIVVPVLTLIFHLPIQIAIGASIISVIATSSGAAAAYVRDHLTNLRMGMFLEIATTLGAISGAYLTSLLHGNILNIIFGLVLLYSLVPMLQRLRQGRPDRSRAAVENIPHDPIASALSLDSDYYDPALHEQVYYRVRRVPLGFVVMYGAGVISGLLGIGAGVFKVLAMDNAMGMPIKASSATSNFMIGVTAAASAGIYFIRGTINPIIAGPVAIGILAGSLLGSYLLTRTVSTRVRLVFLVVMALTALSMLAKGVGFI